MKICICDDDAVWLARCREMVGAFFAKRNEPYELFEFSSGDSLMFEAEDIAPKIDILLLDIYMPQTSGVKVAKQIKSYGFAGVTIFLTNSKEHYEDAFDLRIFNYIKKETTDNRFDKVMELAVAECQNKNAHMISLTSAGTTKNIRLDSIIYFEVRHDLVTVHYGKGESFDFYSTLGKLEERLFAYDFFRVQRSYLVNLRQVEELKYGVLKMSNGAQITVGRAKREEVTRSLAELHIISR